MFKQVIYLNYSYDENELEGEMRKNFIEPRILKEKDVFYIRVGNPNYKKNIIFCSGNGSTMLSSLEFSRQLSDYYKANVFIFDYPGYGLNEGMPSEETLVESLKTIVDIVENPCLIGHSLGCGVILSYIAKYGDGNIKTINLISPFKNLVNVITDNMFAEMFFNQMSEDKYHNSWNIQFVTKRTVVHALETDSIVNIEHSRRVYDLIRTGVRSDFITYEYKNLDHNSFVSKCIGNISLY